MSEDEFVSQIDCRFPYHDREKARSLLTLGCKISANAAFTVVHELALVPVGVEVHRDTRLGLLQEIASQFNHPLRDLILKIATRLARGEHLCLAEVKSAMGEVARFPGQYQALNLVYFSGENPWDEVDDLYREILEQWCPPVQNRA